MRLRRKRYKRCCDADSLGLERHSGDMVEHQKRNGHVSQIDHGPSNILGHAGDGVDEEFAQKYQHGVDEPRAWMSAAMTMC